MNWRSIRSPIRVLLKGVMEVWSDGVSALSLRGSGISGGTGELLRRGMLFVAVPALISICPAVAAAQIPTLAVSDTIWEFRLIDGSTVLAQVVARLPDRLSLRTPGGATVDVDQSQIRSVRRPAGSIRDGRVWPRDPNLTRLFFAPTGRMLQSGDGYVGAFELFLPFVAYGAADFLTIAGGTPIVPGAIGQVWYFAPKLGATISPGASVSAGVLAFMDTSAEDSDRVGIAYTAGTFGSEDDAVTLGLGWGFAGDDVERRPVFLLGAETRISPRVKLLSENYLITYREGTSSAAAGVLTGGIRFIGGNLSADAGLAVMAGEGDFSCCLPLVNFVYNFGGNR